MRATRRSVSDHGEDLASVPSRDMGLARASPDRGGGAMLTVDEIEKISHVRGVLAVLAPGECCPSHISLWRKMREADRPIYV